MYCPYRRLDFGVVSRRVFSRDVIHGPKSNLTQRKASATGSHDIYSNLHVYNAILHPRILAPVGFYFRQRLHCPWADVRIAQAPE